MCYTNPIFANDHRQVNRIKSASKNYPLKSLQRTLIFDFVNSLKRSDFVHGVQTVSLDQKHFDKLVKILTDHHPKKRFQQV